MYILMAEREFPAVFYDGEREISMGNVRVNSSLDFKSFQLGLSQRIGISPNQITVYLVDPNKSAPELRRKVPVTSKVNFGAIVREKAGSSFFLAVLKRTRRNRRSMKGKRYGGVDFGEYFQDIIDIPPPPPQIPENFLLLRRNQPDFDHIYNERLLDLQVQRANYEAMVWGSFPSLQQSLNASCKECEIARRQGKFAPFHLCVYDDVVVGGFQSPAGPIAPPRKAEK